MLKQEKEMLEKIQEKEKLELYLFVIIFVQNNIKKVQSVVAVCAVLNLSD